MDRASIVFTVACISLLLSAPMMAAPVLDQYQEGASPDTFAFLYDSLVWGQTFTAGQSGTLDHLELGASGNYPATVEIRDAAAGGEPGSNVLGTVFMSSGFTSGWNSIDFGSQNIAINAGTMYSIVLRNPDPENGDRISANWDPDSYAGGGLWHLYKTDPWTLYFPEYGEADMQFRTFVNQCASPVPAPSVVVLVGIGTAVVGWLRKRDRSGNGSKS
jgi:hypothetical protein